MKKKILSFTSLLVFVLSASISMASSFLFSDTANLPANINQYTIITTSNNGMWVITDGNYYAGSQKTEEISAYQDGSNTIFSYMQSGVSFTVIQIPDLTPIITSTQRPGNMNPGTVLSCTNGQIWKITSGSYYGGSTKSEDVIIYQMNNVFRMSFQTSGVTMVVELIKDSSYHKLTVNAVGSSNVTIIGNPFEYGGTTNYIITDISDGTQITLTAPAYNGVSTFSLWSGCDTTSADICMVSMTSHRTVTANYKNDNCFSQADIDAKYDEGYQKGLKDGIAQGSGPPNDAVIINSDLSFKIENSIYQSLLGDSNIWVDFKFYEEQNGKLLWELVDFGQK